MFFRKQLACFIERQVRPRRTDDASRIALALLSSFVDWRELLTIVRPETLVRWRRDLFRLFWRLKSRHRGRPRIPADVQRLIVEMAMTNRTWGEERIAAELRLKLGLPRLDTRCFVLRLACLRDRNSGAAGVVARLGEQPLAWCALYNVQPQHRAM